MHNRLLEYLRVLNDTFVWANTPFKENEPLSEFQAGENAQKIRELYNTNIIEFERFKDQIKTRFGLTYCRDLTQRDFYLYNIMLSIEDNKYLRGICLMLSFVGNYIGIYYTDFYSETQLSNPSPIRVYDNKFDDGVDDMFDVSYVPFNETQIHFAKEVINLALKHFPNFSVFDNNYASQKISNIETYSGYYKETDLFQAIFTNYIHGLI